MERNTDRGLWGILATIVGISLVLGMVALFPETVNAAFKTMEAAISIGAKKEENTEIGVYFDLNFGSGDFNRMLVEQGGAVIIPNKEPARDGHDFVYWKTPTGDVHHPGDVIDNIRNPITLIAQWGIDDLKVEYSLEGGEFLEGTDLGDLKVQYGKNYHIVRDVPEKKNYTFSHWNYNGMEFRPGEVVKDAHENITLNAFWIQGEHRVDYVLDGGTADLLFGDTIGNGGDYTIPKIIPKKEGHKFIEWEDATDGKSYNPGDTIEGVLKSYTLKAKYKIDRFTVTFDINGGTIGTPSQLNSRIVDYGTYITMPSETPKGPNDAIFSGWMHSGSRYEAHQKVMVNENMNFVANYEEITRILTYDLDGGSGDFNSQVAREGIAIKVSTNIPTKKLYTFSHWQTATGEKYNPGSNITLSGDAILTAQWVSDGKTIKFNLVGGDKSSTFNDDIIDSSISTYTLPSERPVKTGNDFNGWYNINDKRIYQPGTTVQNIHKSTEFVARWTLKPIKITYNLDGATPSLGAPSYSPITTQYRAPHTVKEAKFTKAHHVFVGWYIKDANSTSYQGEKIIKVGSIIEPTKDIEITAHWLSDKYYINFNLNGGKAPDRDHIDMGGEGVFEEQEEGMESGVYERVEIQAGETYYLPSWDLAPIMDVHELSHWVDIDTGTRYNPGDPLPTITRDVRLDAVWKLKRYNLEYYFYGDGILSDPGSLPTNVEYGTAVVIPDLKLVKENQRLIKWTATDQFGTVDVGPSGHIVKGHTKFHAVWESKNKLTFKLNGGNVNGSTVDIVQYVFSDEDIPTDLITPITREGYNFKGWSPDISKRVSKDTIFTAQWGLKEYTVSFDSDGGTSIPSQTVKHGGNVTKPADPKRSGYRFDGWEPSLSAPVTGNRTHTAKWVEQVQIIHYLGSLLPNRSETSSAYGFATSEEFTLTSGQKYYWEISGYIDSQANIDGKYLSSHLYATDSTWSSVLDIQKVGSSASDKGWKATSFTAPKTQTYLANNYMYSSGGRRTGKVTISSSGLYLHANNTVGNGTSGIWKNADINSTYTLPQPQMTRVGKTFGGWINSVDRKTYQPGSTVTLTAKTTFTAVWNVNKYTATFNSDGGTPVAPQTVNHGSTPTPTNPTKEGYTFTGWSPALGPMTKNQNYTALWRINRYTATFNSDGGTPVASQTIVHGDIPNPETPTKEGYTFTGWSPALGPMTRNQTYKAQWSINKYTATFDSNGGTAVPSQTVNHGATPTPAAPKRTGYTFAGWSPKLGPMTKDQTFKAQWNINSYKVTFNANGGTPATTSVMVEYGSVPTLPKVTRKGHTFSSWSGDPTAKVTGDRTHTASWTVNKYTVSYNANGGSGTMSNQTVTYGQGFGAKDNKFTREGYTFVSWNEKPDGTGKSWIENPNGTHKWDYTKNITLYAQWSLNSYKVTFNANGGTPATTSVMVDYGNKVPSIPVVARTGYTFSSWSGDPTAKVTGNRSHTANWTANKYKITYNANSGSGTMSNQTVTFDQSFNPSDNKFTKVGHTFIGWNEKADGTGTSWEKDKTYVWNYAEDITLYAQWRINKYTATFNSNGGTAVASQTINYGVTPKPATTTRTGYTFKGWSPALAPMTKNQTFTAQWEANKYTVSYNANGGSGSMSSQTVTYGQSFGAKNNEFTRTGYTFMGWNEKADGTGTSWVENPNGTNPWNYTKNITLYAQWRTNRYTLTVNPNGGKFNGSTSTTTITNDYLVNSVFRKPTRTGYTFAGWTESGSGTITPYGTHIPARTDSTLENDSYWMDKMGVYNNRGNGTTTVVNTTGTNPYDNSNRFMRITSTGTVQSPGRGGFVFSTTSSANKVYYHVIVAKVPVGVTLRDARNAIGDGGSSTWLTSREGTGKMETYIYRVNAGASGSFSSFGHVYANGGSNTLIWDVYYSHVFEANGATMTNSDLFAFNHTGNKTITAKWTINKYTATFNSNGGTPVASQTLNYGSTPEVAPPTRTGYTFKGWSPELGPMTKNQTFTAQWSINKYTVAYNANGGSGTMSNQTVTYGQSFGAKNNEFTRTGYTFTGWNEKADGTGASWVEDPNGTWKWNYTKNITLYAQWKINKYTATFNSNGGTSVPSQALNHGETPTPVSPTRTGYKFAGWSPALGPMSKDQTYTAQWTINKYTATFNSNGGTAVPSQTVNHGAKPTPVSPTRTGYTFAGWSPELGPMSKDQTYTAKWTINKYTATFNSNGGTPVPSQTLDYGTTPKPATPTRTGYTFTGWSPALGPLTKDQTYTAKWKINKYTVSFDLNGGSGSIANQTVNHGSKATVPTNPTRTGYTFAGWSPAISNAITGNTTFTAQWTINKYTVSFDLNGGSGSAPNQTVNHGSKATVPTNPTRAGYTFAGWSPAIGTTITGNTTFKAQWTVNKYPLNYHLNNGSGEVITVFIASSEQYTITRDIPFRKGYVFKEWNTKEDGTGASYTAGRNWGSERFRFPNLYAQWTINKHTVTFDSNGGTPVASQTVNHGSYATRPNNPTRTGYTFTGWSPYLGTTITSDRTFVAQWRINTYTVSFNTNGGSSVASQSVNHGSTPTTPANPTRSGYRFDGWSPALNTPVTANRTHTARWVPQVQIIHSLGSLLPSGTATSSNYGFATSESFTLTGGQKYYWEIAGYIDSRASADGKSLRSYIYEVNWNWSNSIGVNKVGTSASDRAWTNTSFTAPKTQTYRANNYLFASGGSRAGKATITNSNIFLHADNAVGNGTSGIWKNADRLSKYTLPQPQMSWTGYTFGGWKNSVDGKTYQPGSTVTLTAKTTFSAIWIKNTYTVSYNVNSSHAKRANSLGSQTATYNSNFTPRTPSTSTLRNGRNDKVFNGYYKTAASSGTTRKAGTAFKYTTAGNTTLYAQWRDVKVGDYIYVNGRVGTSSNGGGKLGGTFTGNFKVTIVNGNSWGIHIDGKGWIPRNTW